MTVPDDWCLRFSGYHLYYLRRQRASAAFSLFVDAQLQGLIGLRVKIGYDG